MNEQPKVSAELLSGAGGATAGMLLRRAREASGLHVAALAVAMKVPVKKLEALEADRLGDLPDAVFVRALAGSMCRALKIDPAPILSRLPQSAAPKLNRDERGINMPFDASRLHYGSAVLRIVSRPAALWVIGLLLAALLVLYFPEVQIVGKTTVAPVASVEIATPSSSVVTNPLSGIPSANGVEAAAAAVSSPAVAASAPVRAASEGISGAMLPLALPAQVLVSSDDLLVFKAKSVAWVRVSDAKGAIQFEKTLSAGETATASGLPPLTVVVGNVAATELQVRGKTFNLDEVAKNNVARFEVK
jgi:cytoskeleton protein RodZ